jgi:hypothetical protein
MWVELEQQQNNTPTKRGEVLNISLHTDKNRTMANGKTVEASYNIDKVGGAGYVRLAITTPDGSVDLFLHSLAELTELAFTFNTAERDAIDSGVFPLGPIGA